MVVADDDVVVVGVTSGSGLVRPKVDSLVLDLLVLDHISLPGQDHH